MSKELTFTPEMSLLDAVSLNGATETVFRSYDGSAGVCLLCTHLFDSIEDVANRYDFDLEELLDQLKNAAANASTNSDAKK